MFESNSLKPVAKSCTFRHFVMIIFLKNCDRFALDASVFRAPRQVPVTLKPVVPLEITRTHPSVIMQTKRSACGCSYPIEPTHGSLSKAAALASAAVALVTVVGMLLQLVRFPRPCIACHVVPNASPAPSKQCERLLSLRRMRACPCAVKCRME